MTTPTFKLLANSLRLGQPPEPMAAFKVLVEVIQQQENELADLRQRVNLLASRVQFAEAKAARLEAASLATSGTHAATPHDQPLATIPKMPPVPRDPRRPKIDLDANPEDFQGTLNVPRADIDAVVKHLVENEAPYPLSPPGGQRAPHEPTGMPFKPARPLDPSGGSLHESRTPSRPPPPMAAERPRSVPPPPPPPSEPSDRQSVPYIAIEEADFSATAENQAVEMPMSIEPVVPAAPRVREREPNLESILDESSYDDSVLTSILKRKPGGQGG
jgi:hypothetical protein